MKTLACIGVLFVVLAAPEEAPTPVERSSPIATPVVTSTPAPTPVATKKPKPTPKPKPKPKKTPDPAAAPIAPGTRFRVVAFGENDPLANADPPLVGMECVADGFLLRYQHVAFHYGQAKCGPDEKMFDLLAAKIEVLEKPKAVPVPTPSGQ